MRYRQKCQPSFRRRLEQEQKKAEKVANLKFHYIFDDISLNIIFLTKSFRIRVEEDLRHILTAGSITRSEVEQFLN